MLVTRILQFGGLIFCFFAMALGLMNPAVANVSDIQLKHLSVAEGLSQGVVTDIVEDHNGFMWFATNQGGLNRFDGYDFKQYYHSNDNPNSLPHSYVRALYIDQNNTLWAATRGGLARYIPEKDHFKHYSTQNSQLLSNEIWTISESSDGKLLVANEDNLFQYDAGKDDLVPMEISGAKVPSNIRVIFSESDRTWLGTRGYGVAILNHADNRLYTLTDTNPWNLNLDIHFLNDLKLINGQYWLATEKGVHVLDKDNNLVRHYSATNTPAIAGNIVFSIETQHDGKVWLGTSEGFSIIDLANEDVFNIDYANARHVGLEDPFVTKIYRDSQDSIWLGSYASGLYKFSEQFSHVKHFKTIPKVWAMKQAQDGNIWIATQNDGVREYDPLKGTFTAYLQKSDITIWDLALDSQKRIWLATSNGVLAYELVNGELVERAEVMHGEMVDRFFYANSKLWFWSDSENLLALDTNTFVKESYSLPNPNIEFVTPLFLDSNQNLWLKTNLGVALLNTENKQSNQLILNVDTAQVEFVDVFERDNMFWVVTASQGIFKLHGQSYHILETAKLPENEASMRFVTALATDESIWLASHNRIDEFSLKDKKRVKFISSLMLDYNDLNEGSGLVTKNGHVLFGGVKGFHIIKPEKLGQKRTVVSQAPTFTQLSVFNRPVDISQKDSPLKTAIHLAKEIVLGHEDFPFSLRFAQLNSPSPLVTRYRYKLEGLNDNWLETDARVREATFSNLLFGTYDFYVQSRDGENDWSPAAHMKVTVKPPFWLHHYAMILYGILLFLLLAYWFKQYKIKAANQLAIKESEERLKLTLWSSGDELWDWDIYRGQVIRANTWGTLDFPQDNIRANSSYQANIHPDDIAKLQSALKEHIDKDTDHFQATYRAKTFKGEWIWVLDRGKVVRRDNNNQPLRMTGTLKNISHLKLAEEQLKLFKRSIENISDGVFIADTSFRFISVNKAYCKYTGETREQGLASYLKFHQYPEAFTEEVKKSLQQKGTWFGEVEARRTNGEKYEMELNIDSVKTEDGKISHYVGVFSDITSRKSTEKELLKLANTDPLTEMPNRSFFQASHGNLVRKGVPHALICLDMDNFKKINDSLGHQTGDQLIKDIGRRLQRIAGINSTCYRLGGDEFSILLDNSKDMHTVTHIAQSVLDEMARPFFLNKQEFVLGASVGIAFYPEDGNTPQELLKNADTAMYFAKNSGGNKYQFFSGEMNQNAVRQLQIENLIRHGLKEDLFTVFYQPKVDIASGKLVSMEALVRFEHPEKGIVSPAQFIPLAEQTGQIIEIGEMVMRKACEDTKRWVKQGLFTGRVAINISARQFELGDLDDRINRILHKVGLSPLHLECEITEGTLMQNPDQALRMMERLRERGIHLALDDFGTGYSSLAYLKKFPLNTLKIDKAFIDDIATSSVDKHMTAAIINIAHNLGLKVVAEGVEQEKQLAILRRYDCEMLQGYLYSKPLNSARFEKLLKENQQLTQIMHQSDA